MPFGKTKDAVAAAGLPQSFELLDRDVDSIPLQLAEGLLHAPGLHERPQPGEIVAGSLQERAIGAVRVGEDRPLGDLQEGRAAVGQTPPRMGGGVVQGNRNAEEGGHVAGRADSVPE